MCDVIKRDGSKCATESRFMVNVRTVPQPLGDGGKFGMEISPAGRSMLACSPHLASAVLSIDAIEFRWPGAVPTVSPFRR